VTKTADPSRGDLGNETVVSVRRFVNDETARAARRFGRHDCEFVCECGDLMCDEMVKMTLADYHASTPGSVVRHG
jgi:hypothetical protein